MVSQKVKITNPTGLHLRRGRRRKSIKSNDRSYRKRVRGVIN